MQKFWYGAGPMGRFRRYGHMSRAQQLRWHANDCDRIAETLSNSHAKAQLMEVATYWHELARQGAEMCAENTESGVDPRKTASLWGMGPRRSWHQMRVRATPRPHYPALSHF
jgi:hypothetical protein